MLQHKTLPKDGGSVLSGVKNGKWSQDPAPAAPDGNYNLAHMPATGKKQDKPLTIRLHLIAIAGATQAVTLILVARNLVKKIFVNIKICKYGLWKFA